MRLTGLGHASVLIETAHGIDPDRPVGQPGVLRLVVPVPRQLAAGLGRARAGRLPVRLATCTATTSTPSTCAGTSRKKATVLLPEFPTTELEDALRELGFTSFVTPASRRGRRARRAAGHDPVADLADRRPDRRLVAVGVRRRSSRCSTRTTRARPSWTSFTELGPIDALPACSSPARSGSRWSTSCRRGPSRRSARPKRERQFDRTLRYIEELRRAVRVPDRRAAVLPRRGAVGLQRHLRRRVEHLPRPDASTSTGCASKGHDEGRLLLPGTVAALDEPGCPVTHPYDPAPIFARQDEDRYLREMQARRMPEVEAAKATLGAPGDRHPRRAHRVVHAAAGRGRSHRRRHRRRRAVHLPRTPSAATSTSCIDFVAREVRPYAGEKVRYRFRTRRAYVEQLIARARDRLGQLAVPVVPVLGAAHRPVQRVRLRLLQVPVRGAAELRRGLVRRAERRRGRRDGHARRLGGAAPLPAPQGRPDAVRHGRRRRADLPDARLEVAADRRQVPHLGRPRHPQRTGRGRRAEPSAARPGNRTRSPKIVGVPQIAHDAVLRSAGAQAAG